MIGTTIKGWFSGVNLTLTFYKWLVGVLILVGATTMGYREGLHDGESRKVAEDVADLKTQLVEERTLIVKELEVRQTRLVKRMEEINRDSKEAARLQRELDAIGETLDELINKKPSNPACAPSHGMLEQYRRLAEATRTPS